MSNFTYDSKNKNTMVNVDGAGPLPVRAVSVNKSCFDSYEHNQFGIVLPLSGHSAVPLAHLVESAITYQATLDRLQEGLTNLHALINKNDC